MSNKTNMLVSCGVVFTSLTAISLLMYFNLDKFYLIFPTLAYQVGFSFGLGPTTWTIVANSMNKITSNKVQRGHVRLESPQLPNFFIQG